jgi:hypothetical protein
MACPGWGCPESCLCPPGTGRCARSPP